VYCLIKHRDKFNFSKKNSKSVDYAFSKRLVVREWIVILRCFTFDEMETEISKALQLLIEIGLV
jgi:hypothetical protein